jgi:hypothetical protein
MVQKLLGAGIETSPLDVLLTNPVIASSDNFSGSLVNIHRFVT